MFKLKRNIIISILAITALIGIALTVIMANISSISDPYTNELVFDKNSFVGQWPFAVESVVIRCDDINNKSIVSMTTPTGEGYILNTDSNVDPDKTQMKLLRPEHAVWLDFPADTEKPKTNSLSSGVKIPIDDIISTGLKLCVEI
ncbi:hypothetical protein [Psychrobacter sp. DAB_AL43B]|uniref:hypothetical protein n=1 Tax=Psychrobacter sp. DAB_AL43B TaxID=1028416 RepID=UPI0009A819B4|nr:hypothetical protein [Psychrobacter sp. DAB_AL43B]SLJ85493.1 hypothetical protein DABAL43B_2308 [Psychrobacter sp. DAB_AL43B]